MIEFGGINTLLGIALIFAAGHPAGLLARRIGVPAVTGNILAGVMLGPSALGFFDADFAREMETVTIFAMGFVTVAVGGHLSYRRLHNAKRRISSVTFFEVTATCTLVTLGCRGLGLDWPLAFLLGSIATATAPATVLAVVREERAKGLLVKTTLASVALDNFLCILLFSIAVAAVGFTEGHADGFVAGAMNAGSGILMAGVLGCALGYVLLKLVSRDILSPFSGLFIAILLACGGAEALGVSPLLACLCMGVVLGNSGRETEELVTSLETLEPVILTSFFTLAGIDLHLGSLKVVGAIGAVYFFARATGKVLGGFVGGVIGGAPERVRNHLGFSLLPQAGLAIGLLVIIQGDPRFSPDMVLLITNVVLATVVVNEIMGPWFVRRALKKTGESGKARRRIVEFLQEEHILAGMKAENKWDSIKTLCDFLIKSHGMTDVNAEELVATVEERERSFSTAIGLGIAIPHARLESGPEIMGVMGIVPEGVDFHAPDGQLVHVIILIATPEEHKDQHLEVMAAVARIMSHGQVRTQLFAAKTPAEAFEIIENDTKQHYNYFLEE